MKATATTLKNWKINLFTLFTLVICQLPLSAEETVTTIDGKGAVCEGEITTYTYPYTSGNNYVWSVIGGTGVATIDYGTSEASFTVNWGLAGSPPNSVSLQEYNSGVLVVSHTKNVTISGSPEPEITSDFNSDCIAAIKRPNDRGPRECETVCEFSDVTYTTPFTSGSTYAWTVIGNTTAISGSNTNTATVSWGGPGQAYVIVTETNAAGCIGTDTICIEIVEKPLANFGVQQGDQTVLSSTSSVGAAVIEICLNGTVCFDDASTGASSWFWDFGNGNTSTQQNPCETYTSPGTYIVKQLVENECHCIDTSFIIVEVSNEEGPEIVCQNVVCGSGTFIYDAILPSPCTGGFYEWNISTNGNIVNASGSVSTLSPQTVTGTDITSIEIDWSSGPNGTISLSISGCSGTCDNITTANIPIIPDSINIEGDSIICLGESGQFKVPCYPGTQYKWSINDSVIFTGDNEFIQPFYMQGTYQISVSFENDLLGCNGLSNDFTVRVLSKFEIQGNKIICEGDSAVFDGPIGSSLFWRIKDQSGTVVDSSGNSASFTSTSSLLPGSYSIIATDMGSPRDFCNETAIYGLEVIAQPPTPTAINGPTEVCTGEASIYTAAAISNDYLLEWEIDNNGVISTVNGNVATVSWTSGSKSITLYQISKVNGCRSAAYTITINDRTPPPISIFGDTIVCGNTNAISPILYHTTAILDGYEWSISPSNAGSVVGGQGTDSIEVIWNNYNGLADVVLTPIVCNNSFTPVNYSVNVTTPNMTINGPDTICQNDTSIWNALFDLGSGSGFTWEIESIDSAIIVASGTGSSATYHFPNSSGSFIVRISATNCMLDYTEIKNVIVHPAPVANLSYSGNINCIDYNAATLILSTQGASTYTYTWYHNSTLISPQPTGTTHTIGNDSADAGAYYVVIVDSNGCSTTTNNVVAKLCVSPGNCTKISSYADFSYSVASTSPIPGCNMVSFNDTISPTPASILWDFAGFGNSSGNNPDFQFPASGIYPITMTALYGFDTCKVVDTLTVIVPVISNFEINISCIGNNFQVNLINTSDVVIQALSSFNHKWKIYNSSSVAVDSSTLQDFLNVSSLIGGNSYTISLQETHTYTWGGQTVNADCTYETSFIMPQKAEAAFIMSDTIVCQGNKVIFTDQSIGNINGWNWHFDDGSSILTQNPEKTYQDTANLFNVQLLVEDEYGCVDSSSKQLDVKANNIDGDITVSPSMPICPDTIASLTFNNATFPSSAPYQYLWSDNTSGITTTADQTSTHYIVVTDNYGCFKSFGPKTVEVVNMPSAIINGKENYCIGEEIQLDANYGSTYTYQWYEKILPSTSFVLSTSTSPTLTLPFAPIGMHEFKVLITDTANNCVKTSPTFTITVNGKPLAPFISTNPSPACPYNPVELTVTNPMDYQSITWSTGVVDSTTTAYASGTYYAEVTDTNGCKNFNQTTVFELPDFCGFMCGCYTDCIAVGDTFFFPGIQGNYALWQWEKFDGTAWDTVSSGTGTVDDYTVTTASTESIRLYVKTINGCDGYSCEADLDIIICMDPCEGQVSMSNVACKEIIQGSNAEYNFTLDINFAAFGSVCSNYSYTIIPPVGSIDSLDTLIIYSGGSNQINGVWNTGGTYYSQGEVCFDIVLENPCDKSTCLFTKCFFVKECGQIIGIQDNNLANNSINFYPNPSNGNLNMETTISGNYDVNIYSIQGKLVYSKQLSFFNSERKNLQLEHLNSGIYIIRCISDNNIVSKRIIIN